MYDDLDVMALFVTKVNTAIRIAEENTNWKVYEVDYDIRTNRVTMGRCVVTWGCDGTFEEQKIELYRRDKNKPLADYVLEMTEKLKQLGER